MQEWELFKGIETKSKVAACVILIKNSLSKGNPEVTLTLKETKHPKDKTFDKIFSMMLENCVDKIEERTVSSVNILIIHILYRFLILKILLYMSLNMLDY